MNLSLCYMMMFMMGMISLCWNHKHIMMSLLSLEFIILSLFCYFSFILSYKMSDTFMLLTFLTFGVGEGVLGLSCLVVLIRSHGNDNLFMMNMMLC
uniref:NADH-ubiquinone oxidoreductase chain 4L n=1 Tax=Graptopsaltria nigrofuscata TaxID=93686 RepID=A0A344ALJ8_9HEMI|nr:NADH dehydrogenase subunit 4L [Graptopsaltria nigrofuscata]AWV84468.1 NADH dehydrogenase subunit 4L [Graptopsaltria nigrofuscata]